ncbi:hypothetical protein [Nocardia lijiangensis]|uniref:hypothetical protein n=1 Tax=Nocardia lijiangensis TaxID=299618 RepID=UPI003D74EB35
MAARRPVAAGARDLRPLFDADDARRALDASIYLFAEVAAEVATRLGFPWRGELVDGVRRLLAEYRTHP